MYIVYTISKCPQRNMCLEQRDNLARTLTRLHAFTVIYFAPQSNLITNGVQRISGKRYWKDKFRFLTDGENAQPNSHECALPVSAYAAP